MIVKRCACGASYDAVQWGKLQLVGEQDDGVERLELRQCACASTIAIVLGPSSLGTEDTIRCVR